VTPCQHRGAWKLEI